MEKYKLRYENGVNKEIEADYFAVDGSSIEFYERKTGEDELLCAFRFFISCEKLEKE